MIIVHHADLDGQLSALAVEGTAKKAMLIPTQYGWGLPYLHPDEDKTIVIVDFFIGAEETVALTKKFRRVVWIDHHITAERAWDAYAAEHPEEASKVEVVLDTTRAACLSAAEWAGAPVTDLVAAAARADTGRAEDEDLPWTLGAEYIHAQEGMDGLRRVVYGDVDPREAGRVLFNYHREQARRIFSSAPLMGIWHGEDVVPCIVVSGGIRGWYMRWVPDDIRAKCDIVASAIRGERGWGCTLYWIGRDYDRANCHEIAIEHGGGGHPGAAGFRDHLVWPFVSL